MKLFFEIIGAIGVALTAYSIGDQHGSSRLDERELEITLLVEKNIILKEKNTRIEQLNTNLEAQKCDSNNKDQSHFQLSLEDTQKDLRVCNEKIIALRAEAECVAYKTDMVNMQQKYSDTLSRLKGCENSIARIEEEKSKDTGSKTAKNIRVSSSNGIKMVVESCTREGSLVNCHLTATTDVDQNQIFISGSSTMYDQSNRSYDVKYAAVANKSRSITNSVIRFDLVAGAPADVLLQFIDVSSESTSVSKLYIKGSSFKLTFRDVPIQ